MRKIRTETNSYAKTTAYRNRIKKLLARFKIKKGCLKCGYNKCSFALHFAHKTYDKKGRSNAIEPYWKKDRIKQELNKCNVLCATCHAEQTAKHNEHNHKLINILWKR